VETALQKSEENYRLLFESAGQGILIAKDETIQFANAALADIVGYPKKVITTRPFISFIHPDDRKIVLNRHKMRLKGEIPENDYQFRAVTSNGTVKWLQINARIITWDGVPASLSFITDITDRRQAQEELRASEEKYRTIFENAQEGIYQTTCEGKFIMANQAMARILGYDAPEELLDAQSDLARRIYVNPEDRTKVIEQVQREGVVRGQEIQFYRRDGRKIWISRTMRIVRDDQNNEPYLEGIVEDITEKKESVDRLRKALGGTVQAIASVVETKDPYTAGHQRRVADLARAMGTEMHLSSDQIEGLRMAGIIHDIGKISVPAEILSTPRRLTAIEFSLIKMHAQSGFDILKDVDFPWPIARMVLEHHERMDGSGYPNGLTGNDILLESRVLAVADVVEAMATHRPYRPALGLEAALEEINSKKGILYDPQVVSVCQRLFQDKNFVIKA
jgi:PAS domain S-box-containing protein